MEVVFAIFAFFVFSVITDAIEGKKKKRQQSELPDTKSKIKIKVGAQEKRPEIILPPIKGAPTMQSDKPIVYAEAAMVVKTKPIEKIKKSEKVNNQPLKTESKPVNPVVIQPEVILNAVCYAQILQPPKAYQYMATRSCRGDWNNTK
jgi:hypothetical protein